MPVYAYFLEFTVADLGFGWGANSGRPNFADIAEQNHTQAKQTYVGMGSKAGPEAFGVFMTKCVFS